jgi:hypothetical protein
MSLIDINSIKVRFPSPATLNMNNISEQIQAVGGNAEFIAQQLIPQKADGSNDDIRMKLQAKIVQDLLPGIDWEKYEEFKKDINIDGTEETILTPPPPPEEMGGGFGGY